MEAYIRINNYDILDENGNVIESGLVMDEEATIENMEVMYIVESVDGGPIMRPKTPR